MNHPQGENIEAVLESMPDVVASALQDWRIATLDREKVEALLYAATKAQDSDKSAAEIKAIINANPDRYQAVLNEIKAESQYVRLYERLLSAKKRASLRTAF